MLVVEVAEQIVGDLEVAGGFNPDDADAGRQLEVQDGLSRGAAGAWRGLLR